jgi:hypothetical protein
LRLCSELRWAVCDAIDADPEKRVVYFKKVLDVLSGLLIQKGVVDPSLSVVEVLGSVGTTYGSLVEVLAEVSPGTVAAHVGKGGGGPLVDRAQRYLWVVEKAWRAMLALSRSLGRRGIVVWPDAAMADTCAIVLAGLRDVARWVVDARGG